MDLSDERQPLATPGTGSTLTLSDKFSLKELTEQQEDIKEEDMKFSANFKASLNNGAKLKFGAKVVRKTKGERNRLLRIYSERRGCLHDQQPEKVR